MEPITPHSNNDNRRNSNLNRKQPESWVTLTREEPSFASLRPLPEFQKLVSR